MLQIQYPSGARNRRSQVWGFDSFASFSTYIVTFPAFLASSNLKEFKFLANDRTPNQLRPASSSTGRASAAPHGGWAVLVPRPRTIQPCGYEELAGHQPVDHQHDGVVPKMCLLGFLCQPCCVMQQRKRLLMEDMRNYECCAGIWGPNCTQRCNGCTKGKEDFCLCLESFFCLACAISGNRWMVRQHYNLENDCCDTFLMALACVLRIIGCLLRTDKCENIADCVFHMVISCMLAQHEHQMNVMGYPLGTAPQSPPQAME